MCDKNRNIMLTKEIMFTVQRKNSNVRKGSVSCSTFNCIKWKTHVYFIGQEPIQNRYGIQWNVEGLCVWSQSRILQREKWMDRILWRMLKFCSYFENF